MNEQDQNVAIAIACGSKWVYNPNAPEPCRILLHPSCVTSMDDELVEAPMSIPPEKESWMYDMLPDYVTDLNDMHEAEKVFTDEQWDSYIHELGELVGHNHRERFNISATAQQRAEAFLKAIGKWKYCEPHDCAEFCLNTKKT